VQTNSLLKLPDHALQMRSKATATYRNTTINSVVRWSMSTLAPNATPKLTYMPIIDLRDPVVPRSGKPNRVGKRASTTNPSLKLPNLVLPMQTKVAGTKRSTTGNSIDRRLPNPAPPLRVPGTKPSTATDSIVREGETSPRRDAASAEPLGFLLRRRKGTRRGPRVRCVVPRRRGGASRGSPLVADRVSPPTGSTSCSTTSIPWISISALLIKQREI
jgi:hypothetical protein